MLRRLDTAQDILEIHADFETKSFANLKLLGAWGYAEHESTDIMCLSISIGNDVESIFTWYPGDPIPKILQNRKFRLMAHNASFERAIWENVLAPRYGFPHPEEYVCTLAMAGIHSLPLGLDGASKALRMPVEKDLEGKKLMLKYSLLKQQKANPTPTLFDKGDASDAAIPSHDLKRIGEYCEKDVEVEIGIAEILKMPEFEQRVWDLDQKINRRGVNFDTATARGVLATIEAEKKKLACELETLTRGMVRSGNQVAEIGNFLSKHGVFPKAMDAKGVKDILETDIPDHCRRVLEIRQNWSLNSIGKYAAGLKGVCKDGRIRGLFQYGGAHTGRWAGRRIQLQNLPQLKLKMDEVYDAIRMFRREDGEGLAEQFGSPFKPAKQLCRPCIFSENGMIVSDFSNIEVRVLAWLAGEDDLLSRLAMGEDVYVAQAAKTYDGAEAVSVGGPIYSIEQSTLGAGTVLAIEGETIVAGEFENDESAVLKGPASVFCDKQQRQISKIAVLAAGFGQGANGFRQTADNWGTIITLEEAKVAIDAYRSANANTKQFWYALEKAACKAVANPGKVYRSGEHIRWRCDGDRLLRARLPSGRYLHYWNPTLVEGKFGDQISFGAGTEREITYGGKLAENMAQATARDFLAAAMVKLDDQGRDLMGHVHDEVVLANVTEDDIPEINTVMEDTPEWGKGCPVAASTQWCEPDPFHGWSRYTK